MEEVLATTGVIQLGLAQPMIDKHGMTGNVLFPRKFQDTPGTWTQKPFTACLLNPFNLDFGS